MNYLIAIVLLIPGAYLLFVAWMGITGIGEAMKDAERAKADFERNPKGHTEYEYDRARGRVWQTPLLGVIALFVGLAFIFAGISRVAGG